MDLYEIEGKSPKISPDVAYIADDVKIIGDVEIEEGVSIYNGVVIEGFPIKIKIGKYSNIQSGTMIHGLSGYETIIGSYNTIGHRSLIHGCTLGTNVTIGIGSIIMGRTNIGDNCLVGAGTLITERKMFPPNSLILGSPGRVIKQLTEKDAENAKAIALRYYDEAIILKKDLKKIN